MAKTSANGATEVARLTVQPEGLDFQMIYVLCSDGRVLKRVRVEHGSGYSVRGRIRIPKDRTAEFLAVIARRDGMAIVED